MIQEIRLLNFKCFQNQVIPCAPVTMMSGLNGLGKSSVLQSLLLLRQSHANSLLEKEGLLLNGELIKLGTAWDVLFEHAQEDLIGFEVSTSAGNGYWDFKYDRESDILLRGSSKVDSRIFTAPLFNNNFHYLQAERFGPRAFYEMSDFMVRQKEQLGTRGEYSAHFLSVFGSTDIPNPSLAKDTGISLSLRHQTEAWLSEISPGTRIHVDSKTDMEIAGLSYSFVSGRQVSNKFRSTNVGFGLTYILPILVAILSAKPNSLILIENPEAHLHPKGQTALGKLIARAAVNGVQIIFETHSDHVLNGLRVAISEKQVDARDIKIHFFEVSSNQDSSRTKIMSPNVDQDGRLDAWPDGFFDEWENSLDALLNYGQVQDD